ncbi:alkaline phosphatase [Jiangella ureilytica]|uniref:Alkaline phosphatase n=1 Tax=Jiangella ureilytica TaxID=2530374 RepID=A0A4R4S3V4_9ACTN|nr:alkaline phosphatase D family protein [Jiangella ureilytica]TDC56694.1 alkaline phosphatase [Jiangella ureilytica]
MEQQLTRRRILQLGGATAAALAGTAATGRIAWASPTPASAKLSDGVFTLGVASGDPLHDRVVIWTRLAADPVALDGAGGMPARPVAVSWEVAHDEQFSRLVRRGMTMARQEDAHSVHIDVAGLEPDRWYFYRFRAEGQLSPVGRTRTAPAPGTLPSSWRFAIASCQNYTAGYYTAYQDMLAGDPDIVFHLGDYIYEGGGQGNLGRGHLPDAKLATLADYRVRLGQYHSDPDLQAIHAAVPFGITWDDHELENNWAGDDADPDRPAGEFAALKVASFQAYWEHMPFRAAQRPDGPSIQLYRRLQWGDLATINILDTRQYRSDHVADIEADGPEAWEPGRTILGAEQTRWLLDGLDGSTSRWNVLAQQVPFFEDPDVGAENDKWDGYRVSRQQVLEAMASGRPRNPIVLSGDIHANRAADLKLDFDDPSSPTVGVEFTGTSITSGGQVAGSVRHDPDPENPHFRMAGAGRGHVLITVTPELARADYRVVDTVRARTSAARTVTSYVVEDGVPGLSRA